MLLAMGAGNGRERVARPKLLSKPGEWRVPVGKPIATLAGHGRQAQVVAGSGATMKSGFLADKMAVATVCGAGCCDVLCCGEVGKEETSLPKVRDFESECMGGD
jgi:hypothetical protein